MNLSPNSHDVMSAMMENKYYDKERPFTNKILESVREIQKSSNKDSMNEYVMEVLSNIGVKMKK